MVEIFTSAKANILEKPYRMDSCIIDVDIGHSSKAIDEV